MIRKSIGARVTALTLAVVGASAAGVLIIAPQPAQAVVWNCTSGFNPAGNAFAHCGNGDSTNFQVVVVCQNRFTLASRYQYGPAKRVGGSESSTTNCEWYERYAGQPWAKGA